MSMNIDISIDGLLNLIRDVVPALERPLKYFILWSALALFLVPWIVLFFLIEALLAPFATERSTMVFPEYAGGVVVLIIVVLTFLTALVYKAKHNAAKRKNDELIEQVNVILDSGELDHDTRRTLEVILGDDSDR